VLPNNALASFAAVNPVRLILRSSQAGFAFFIEGQTSYMLERRFWRLLHGGLENPRGLKLRLMLLVSFVRDERVKLTNNSWSS
jgi:hypothetical protein